jgi:undecaprenyl-diphosphatase
MITYTQAIILGLLQGASELFPISSLGHNVIIPGLLKWNIHQNDNFFLVFLVATHFATALILLFFYKKDWLRIITAIFRSLKEREIKETDKDAKLGWLLIIGTVPAGIIGLIFQDQIRQIFITAKSASFFLILNGILLMIGEILRRKAKTYKETYKESELSESTSIDSDRRIAKLTFFQAVKVGTLQVLALIPGFSRTGATLVGSLGVGLSQEDALRFSFLLATPIITAAAFLKLPDLWTAPHNIIGQIIVGAICSGLTAFLTVKFLTSYFHKKEMQKNIKSSLMPFAMYCLIAGLLSFIYLTLF